MQHHYIQDDSTLRDFCQQLDCASFIAIDTEFVRTRTLLPRLGLLQLCNGEHLALIDPIAIDDLTPFWQLLQNPDIKKVIHACSEDLEVFLTAGHVRPENLIDSQIMMAFLGHGLSLGYAAMVEHFLGITLDKSESRTDWTKRPLTEKQLTYASADVEYLVQLYPALEQAVEQKGWLKAAAQDTQRMIERKFTPFDESALYRNIKMAWRLNPVQLYRLQQLAIWRYHRAKKKDQPLSFIAKDHTLFVVAQVNPKSVGEMAHLEGVEILDVRHQGKAMLAVLRQCHGAEESLYPAKIMRLDEYPGYKQIFKKVKAFIVGQAEKAELNVENIASKKQINQFLRWHFALDGIQSNKEQIDLLSGWRYQLLGSDLLAFAENNFNELLTKK